MTTCCGKLVYPGREMEWSIELALVTGVANGRGDQSARGFEIAFSQSCSLFFAFGDKFVWDVVTSQPICVPRGHCDFGSEFNISDSRQLNI